MLSSCGSQLFRFDVIFLLSGLIPIPITSTMFEFGSAFGAIFRVGIRSCDFSSARLASRGAGTTPLLFYIFSSPSSRSR